MNDDKVVTLAPVTTRRFGEDVTELDVSAKPPAQAKPAPETEFGLGPDDVVIRGEGMAGAITLARELADLAAGLERAGWRVNLAIEAQGGGGALTLSIQRDAK